MNAEAGLDMFLPGLLAWPDGQSGPRLCASQCTGCGRHAFPPMEICSECYCTMIPVLLSGTGVIYSHTTVRVKPPLELPRPYKVAYIDLTEVPLRLFGLLDPEPGYEYRIGERVNLQVRELGVDMSGKRCLRPVFLPAEEAAVSSGPKQA